MKSLSVWLSFAILFAVANAQAESQPSMKIRGAIAGFNGHELQVKTREGKDVKISTTDETKISLLYPVKISDIKAGDFVGVTAVPRGPGGPLWALEVHLFPEAQRGTGEGHYDWDLKPGSSMTNANIDAIVNTNDGKELTLSYKGGVQIVTLPRGVPIVTFKRADKSLLKKGAKIFCMAQQSPDGSLTAKYITVGKGGMKPPM